MNSLLRSETAPWNIWLDILLVVGLEEIRRGNMLARDVDMD